ncbi:MAG: hypothetical protein WCH46_09350 [bacterium]
MRYYLNILPLILFGFVISSCKQDSNTITPESKAKTYYGEAKPFADDSIRSWLKTDLNGNPSSIGVTFKQSAFAKLDMKTDLMLMMMLPAVGGLNIAAPFDHLEIDWVPGGDIDPPYNTAHLDMHCFMLDTATQMMIMAGMDNLTMMMDHKYVPAGYDLMMDAEAMMGVHAMDSTDHDNPFKHTCMFGYSKGELAFMEPMFAKTYLDSKLNFSADIRQPSAYKTSGWYPTKYYRRYDATTNEYSISVDNFVKH